MSESENTVQPPISNNPPPLDNWEQDVLKRLAFASLNEQRRARRWSILFKIIAFAYLFILLFSLSPKWNFNLEDQELLGGKHTAIVKLEGAIASETEANADNIISSLQSAFKDKNTAGVILVINSPGGSPVQAGYITDEIKRLRVKYKNIPFYAVIEDIGASGGYYIAAAADKIYADKASIVGSIGVIMGGGFGFVGSLEKLGIERRLITSGESKGFLDPFSPLKPEDVDHIKAVLNNIHQQFISVVKQGRGTRLKDDPKIFSGLIWTGEEAMKLGLIDGLGNSDYVAREVIKADKKIDFTVQDNYLDRFAERLGSSTTNSLLQQLQWYLK